MMQRGKFRASRQPLARCASSRVTVSTAVTAAALIVGVVGYGAPLAAAAGTHTPTTAQATGSKGGTCAKAPKPGAGQSTTPVTLESAPGGQVPTVAVCIGKHGPFRFAVDTGSARSIVSPQVASELALPAAGKTGLGGDGCVTSGGLVKVPALHAGNLVVQPQVMIQAPLSDWDTTAVDGVLGSDVFGRFKALRLDLSHKTLTVLGNEAAAPSSHTILTGSASASPPSALVSGKPTGTVPLTIVTSPGTTVPYANAAVTGQGPYAFVVATGAPTSTLDETAGYTDHLADTSSGPAPAGIGCSGTVPVLEAGSVSIGSTSHALSMLAIHIPGQERLGVVGYLGLDFLGTTGSVIIDYVGAEMTFLPT